MVSHKMLAKWYEQLSQQTDAGLLLAEAIQSAAGPPKADCLQMAQSIQSGQSLKQVLDSAPTWLPSPDRIFILAGHESGRLPQTFTALSQRHNQIGANLSKLILGLIYPLSVLHIAALALPLMQMIDFETGFIWDASRYITLCLILLSPCWALFALIALLIKTEHPLLPSLMRLIPLLRRYSRMQALADFSNSLGIFLHTGMGIELAWQRSIQLSRDPQLMRAYQSIRKTIAMGGDPSGSLQDHAVFPPDFISYYTTGARTGKLDASLQSIGATYQGQANQAMTYAAIFYSTLLFAAVAGLIAYSIFKIYGGYLDLLMQMMEA